MLFLCYNCVTKMKKTKLEAEASIYLDELRPKKNGKCSVKIKVTFNRKRKYFATGKDLTLKEFKQTFLANEKQKNKKKLKPTLKHLKPRQTTLLIV